MSDDVKLIITSTFGVIVLAWVLIHSTDVNSITTNSATAYGKAVGSLLPGGSTS
jgi:hypothetical protein